MSDKIPPFNPTLRPEHITVEVCGKYGVTPFLSEDGSVGYDISLPDDAGCVMLPYDSRRTIDTGILFRVPFKCWVLLAPRSSSRKKNVRISNTIGIIDPSFNGPQDNLQVDLSRESKKRQFLGRVPISDVHDKDKMDQHLASWGVTRNDILTSVRCPHDNEFHWFVEEEDDFLVFEPGEKFCQVVFLPFYRADLVEKQLEEWAITENRGGHGSTGKFVAEDGGEDEQAE